MKAIMSDKLRKIIRDPQQLKELQKGISKLGQGEGVKKSTVITVGNHQYKLQSVYAESKAK